MEKKNNKYSGKIRAKRSNGIFIASIVFSLVFILGAAVPQVIDHGNGPHSTSNNALPDNATANQYGYAKYVLNLSSNTLQSSNFSSEYGNCNSSYINSVTQVVYDEANQDIYALVFNQTDNYRTTGGNILIISSSTGKIVGNLGNTTGAVTYMAYDPANTILYLVNYSNILAVYPNNTIFKIDPWPNLTTYNSWTLKFIAYDSSNGNLYVSGNRTVSELDPNVDKFTANFTLFHHSKGITVNPDTNELYASYGVYGDNNDSTHCGNFNITAFHLISASNSPSHYLNISAGNGSTNMIFNPSDKDVWVLNTHKEHYDLTVNNATNALYSNISVINSNNKIIHSIRVFADEDQMLYDPLTTDVYLAGAGGQYSMGLSGGLEVINSTTFQVVGNISLPFSVDSLTYDSSNGYIYGTSLLGYAVVTVSTEPGNAGSSPSPTPHSPNTNPLSGLGAYGLYIVVSIAVIAVIGAVVYLFKRK